MGDLSLLAEGLAGTERELQAERAAALARIAGGLEERLSRLGVARDRLRTLSGAERDAAARHYEALREEAERWRWYLEVQREAVGLLRHDALDEFYPIPPPLEAGAARRGLPMPFAYYDRLSPRRQAIYRRSDAVPEVRLPRPELLQPLVSGLAEALDRDDRKAVQAAAANLCRGLSAAMQLPEPAVKVLAARPSSTWGELHGLYEWEPGSRPRIQLWMRTARHRRVVAFRTFLRTLLHEIGHHLDFHHLKLAESFHTDGFFRRESSLFHQLLPEAPTEDA